MAEKLYRYFVSYSHETRDSVINLRRRIVLTPQLIRTEEHLERLERVLTPTGRDPARTTVVSFHLLGEEDADWRSPVPLALADGEGEGHATDA